MKKVLFFITLLAITVNAYGNQPLQLVFETSDGNIAALTAENIVMSVDNDMLSVGNGSQTESFPLEKLTKMYFSYQTAGIGDVIIGSDSGKLTVYTVDGVSAGVFESISDMRDKLGHGVYVVKQGSVTYKIKL